LECLFRKNLES
jgi:hypothetical protein